MSDPSRSQRPPSRRPAISIALVSLGLVAIAVATLLAVETPADFPHARLMFYRDAAGQEQPVRTAADWQIRRRQILAGMAEAMGNLPDRTNLGVPTVEVVEEVKEPKFTRQTLKIAVDNRHSVPAYFYLPNDRSAGARLPAIVALHQTSALGKKSVDGQDEKYPDQRYGRELAERGYIVLAPDYPTFGDYPCDFSDARFASGTILGVFNHMRCIDWLVSRDDVDAGRIGAIGHSLGGHNSMFLAAWDERIKATVSSCGWDPFHYYIPGKFGNWGQDKIMPRVRSQFASDPSRMPFDFYEVVGAFAPRAFLSISPLHDHNFNVDGVRVAIAEASKVYQLLGAGDCLQVRYPDVAHSFPEAERQAAYAFLDQQLDHHLDFPHARLMFYRDAVGQEQPVRTAADWKIRRRQILAGMAEAMGDLPDRTNLGVPTVEVVEEVKEPKYTRQTLKIAVDDQHSVPAYFYLPNERPAGARLPAIMALHQTSSLGKKEIDGQDEKYPDQRYGRELAERGYIVLAPDYPTFGDYPCDFSDARFASGSLLGVFNHMRCIDWLVSRDDVDAGGIGAIGHSLGGHNSMFLAAFDERVKATVSSCGWDPFHYYIPGHFDNWGQDRYIPRVRSQYHSNPSEMPFDFYEVVALFAPRPFLSISPLHDSNFNHLGVEKAIAEGSKVYRLLSAGDYLQVRYPDAAHSFPESERQAAYAFLDQHLSHHPPGAPEGLSGELPRIPPREPDDALKSLSIVPGVRVELAAAEPGVHSPVAIAFDENGAMYVAEMIDYSEQDKDFLGCVRRLEDADGDGRFEKSTVLVDHLSWPTAVICYDGGVFVGAAPDIWYCKDTDGDGRADVRKVVFTGFGRSNVQGLLNSFQWTLDGRIHGATSSSGAIVRHPDDKESAAVNLNGRDFSFDPHTLELRAESGGAQHGLTFDDWGRKYVCSNSDHLQLVVYEDRYIARNPTFAPPPARRSIAADGPAAEVFRTSPVEPWRIVRTRLRIANRSGIVEGGGRASGYFTGATGVTCYRGDAFGEEFRHEVFIGDVGGNLVHRKALSEDGLVMVGRRIDEKREFISSSDIWFRPAQFANGPDGGLYIVDVSREVIEHPASLPPEIKQHLDLTSGRDRGRIWRAVPEGYVRPPQPKLGSATTAELVAALEHRNGWYRDTAARLILQRQDVSAADGLERLVKNAKLPEARMHALYVLAGLGRLTPPTVLGALDDEHPHVREHAVRVAERLADDPAVAARLCRMTADPEVRVRYQLAFSLGEISHGDRDKALAELARQDGAEPLFQAAIFSSLSRGAAGVLVALAGDGANPGQAKGMLKQLANQVGRQAKPEELAALEKLMESLPDSNPASAQLVQGFLEGRAKAPADRRGEIPAKVAAALERMLARARQTAANDSAPAAGRAEAARTLGLGTFAAARETLTALVDNRQPQDVELAAMETLGKFSDLAVAEILIAAWPGMSPRIRQAAGDTLFSRPQWAAAVLDAIDTGKLALADIDPTRLKLLASSSQGDLHTRVEKLLSSFATSPRAEVLANYQSALKLTGQPARGRTYFQKICVSCHRLEGVGNEVGPSLAAIKNRGAEAILLNLLDPNREVNPQYVNYLAILSDGRTISGMIASESASSITLRRAENASDTLQRSDIEELRSTRQSLMPEGLEKQLDPQAVADVIAYLLFVP